MRKLSRRERGFALPMALIVLAVGSVLVAPMLAGTSSRLLSARVSSSSTDEGYATDAGIEDAIWNLAFDNLGPAQIPNVDDSTSYQITDPVNGSVIDVVVTHQSPVIAADDFESDNWSGGSGWSGNWSTSGNVSVINGEQPFQGSYHVRMKGGEADLQRTVDVSGETGLRLQLWVKIKIFEPPDSAELRVSPDGVEWDIAKTWTSDDSDDTYHYVDIDLTPYTMSDQFRIVVDLDTTNGGDKLFIDDVEIVRPPSYEIVVDAGDSTATAEVAIDNGNVTVLSWEKD